MSARKTTPYFFYVLLMLAAHLLVVVLHYNDYFYNPDELMRTQMSSGDSIFEVIRSNRFETHPPLGNIIRHYWLKMGDDIAWVRFMSSFFMVLSGLVLYRLCKEHYSSRVGVIACFLLLFSAVGIMPSFAVRNYSLFLLLMLLLYHFYLRFSKSNAVRDLVGYVACGLLAITTNYTAIILCFVLTLDGVYARYRQSGFKVFYLPALWKWVAASALIGLVFVPFYLLSQSWWLPVLMKEFELMTGELTLSERPLFLLLWLMKLANSMMPYSLLIGQEHLMGIISVVLVTVFVWFGRKHTSREVRIFLAMFLILAGGYIAGKLPVQGARHMYYLVPMLLIIIAHGLDVMLGIWSRKYNTIRWIQVGGVLLAIICASLGAHHKFYRFEEGEAFISPHEHRVFRQFIDETLHNKDLIVTGETWALLLMGPFDSIFKFFPDLPTTEVQLRPMQGHDVAYHLDYTRFMTSKQLFAFLGQLYQHADVARHYKNIWFILVWKEPAIEALYNCPDLQKDMMRFPHNGDKLVFFGLPAQAVFNGGDITHSRVAGCLKEVD